jgi:host factor-I protein
MSSGRTLSPRPIKRPAASEGRRGDTESATGGNSTRQGNLQDAFLNLLRKNKIPVTMFLVKGVKLQGIVTWFDNFSILLRRDGQSQLVYKHAISTIMPGQLLDPTQFGNQSGGRKQKQLQDIFLSRVAEAEVQVTMFLVNGVMLQGRIAAYDLFCMLLERDGAVQLAYKHAVSTIQPASPVDLSVGDDDDDDDQDGIDD